MWISFGTADFNILELFPFDCGFVKYEVYL